VTGLPVEAAQLTVAAATRVTVELPTTDSRRRLNMPGAAIRVTGSVRVRRPAAAGAGVRLTLSLAVRRRRRKFTLN
jgi:uncharacterized protein YqjF (DUF2071 family)